MTRSVWTVVGALVVVGGLLAVDPQAARGIDVAPSPGTSFDPDFFWLPPTAPSAPAATGPFNPAALEALTLQLCELNEAGECAASLAWYGAEGRRRLGRLRVDAPAEAFVLDWRTIPAEPGARREVDDDPAEIDEPGDDPGRRIVGVRLDRFYRMRVFHGDVEIGAFDIDFVRNRRALAAVDTTKYVGLVRNQRHELRFRVQVPTARTRVVVNEIESNGGVPGDWVELHNTSGVPISLGGYLILDNDDTHVYTIPADAVVPPHGYYVVGEPEMTFGLGSADMVRFLTPDAAVLVDGLTWTSHALSSYGRCPDGGGAFQTTTTVTRGAANDCRTLLLVNEVESSGGTPGDWAELYNPGPAPANLAGFVFTDNDPTHVYPLPSVIVPAGGYFVVDEAAMGFGLGSADSARLFRPDGSIADEYQWTAHAATTYGRCPNGAGAFLTTFAPSKGAPNVCTPPVTGLHINEVESNGGVPGDWFELVNLGTTPVDLSGWRMLDNDDSRAPYVFPAGSLLAPGAYLAVDEAAFGFGLGAADSVRIFDAGGTLYEGFSWTAHATTTYARCPDGTGPFTTSTTVTKGASNGCAAVPVVLNEVESNGGVPGDWVEIFNPGASPADVSGFTFSDSDDTHVYTLPAGSTVPAGGYLVLDESAFGFGLGSADSARLFDTAGALVDGYSWTAHAATTYGRCPNGAGPFVATAQPTRDGLNRCPGDPLPWPGDPSIGTVDGANVFGGNMSGLAYEAAGGPTPGVLWGARNGPGSLFRLVWNGSIWTPDSTNGWDAGKLLAYPGGAGSPDAEGVTFAAGSSAGGLYVATERDNNASSVSRNAILRFDPAAAGTTLTATHEWNLTADLPTTGANLGLEAITWIPDGVLVAAGFTDESKGPTYAYTPSDYPNHGTGLFFVGLEANGGIYAYALDHVTGGFTRVATITSGLSGVMDLHYDRDLNDLWAVCDDTCQGRSVVLRTQPGTGRFGVAETFDRPAGMPNLNNEGFTIAPVTECVGNRRPVYWADDSETGGHALRAGTVTCTAF